MGVVLTTARCLGEYGAVGVHGVGGLCDLVRGAGSVTLDVGEPRTGQNIRIAFAPAFVVAADKTAQPPPSGPTRLSGESERSSGSR